MPYISTDRSKNRTPLGTRAFLVATLLLAQPALSLKTVEAQTPRAKSAAPANTSGVSSEPGVTTASYGDWILRCQRLGGAAAVRICEIVQTLQTPSQTAPVAQIAIGRPAGQQETRMAILLPVNISLPSVVSMGGAKGEKEVVDSLDLTWRRCFAGGCLADVIVPEATLGNWRVKEDSGQISFKDADGRDVTISMSFRGMGQALDALAKERV